MTRIDRIRNFAGSDKVAAMATSAARSVTRVALGVAIARMESADAFARFVLLMGAETIASTLINAAITMPLITVSSGASPAEASRFRVAARKGCRILTAVGVPVAVAGVWVMTPSNPATLAAFAVFLAVSMLASPRQGELTAAFRSRRILASELAFAVAAAATLGLLILTGRAPECGPWIALAIGAVLRYAVLGSERVDIATASDSTGAGPLKAVAVPMVIGSAGVTVSSRIQPFVLQAMLGAAQVSTFGAAQTMVGPVRIFSASISGVLRPRLALHARRADYRAFRSAFAQALVPIGAIGSLIALAAIVCGDRLAGVVFGASFADAGACLTALSIYAVLEAIGACSAVAVQSLSANGSRIVTRNRLVVAAVGLALLFPAAMVGGPWAARGRWPLPRPSLCSSCSVA